jgi:uncharacterized protein (TIGR02217 family)
MAFYEVRLPTNVSYGAVGGSGWSTRVTDSDGGFTQRQQLWQNTRGRWVVSHRFRTPAEWLELISLHRLACGKLHGFRFKDWSEFTAEPGEGFVAPDENSVLRLYKAYVVTDVVNSSTQTVYRPIVKPVPDTVVFDPVGPTVDYRTGITTGAENNHGWSGEFDVPVRFDTDIPSLSYDSFGPSGGIVSWDNIEVVEILKQDLE